MEEDDARIGHIMHVDILRPRTRKVLLEHPSYYRYCRELLDFLEAYEHGAAPKKTALPAVVNPEAA
jgi:nitrate/nitrite transport system ATP-binding protein